MAEALTFAPPARNEKGHTQNINLMQEKGHFVNGFANSSDRQETNCSTL